MNAPTASRTFTPPRHLVVLGHPDPDSFSASVARTYADTVRHYGQQVDVRDLYATGFDPCLKAEERLRGGEHRVGEDIGEDLDLLARADIVTLVHPIWFGMPPAITKGYVDRVLGAGFVPEQMQGDAPRSLLAGKRLMQFTSSASTRPWLEEKGQWSALHHAFETYLCTVFGLRDAGHAHFDAVLPNVSARYVEECLEVVRERARAICAEVLSEHRAQQLRAMRSGSD